MSGRYSRNKGRRGEYLLRDHLRLQGWEADRVPLSGASQGFKGDIRASFEGNEYTFELKVRRDAFKPLYSFLEERRGAASVIVGDNIQLVSISYNVSDLVHQTKETFVKVQYPKIDKKIDGLKKYLGECDILVVRDDRKPFIFIRYH